MKTRHNILIGLALLVLLGEATAQVKADTTFKGTAAIARHLTKLRAPAPGARPSDLELRLDINFDLDSDALRPRAKAQLDTLARVLNAAAFSQTAIELAGHTCDIGSAAYNLELSERRAKAAVDYLVDVGQVAPNRVNHRAYGEGLPIILGAKDEQERTVNRRVVIYLPENREALEKMLREMPASEGFRWGVFRYDKNGKATLIDYDGTTTLHSNDEYRIYLRAARSKYIYLYQTDSRGNARWIYPSKELGFSNPLPAGEYFLPGKKEVFALDNTVGTESLSLVVLDSPSPDLEKILDTRDEKIMSQAVSQTVVVRGISQVRTAAAPLQQNANIRSQTLEVMSADDAADSGVQEARIDVSQPTRGDVLNIMGHHREFFMTLKFKHE